MNDLEIQIVIGKLRLSLNCLYVQPVKLIPSSVIMENMMTLTAQAQRELRVARQELQKYRSLSFTTEQQKHLKNFVSFPGALNLSVK